MEIVEYHYYRSLFFFFEWTFSFHERLGADVKSTLSRRENVKYAEYFPLKRELGTPIVPPGRGFHDDVMTLTPSHVCVHTANDA